MKTKALSSAQLRALSVGDRVSRVAGANQNETAQVVHMTTLQFDVLWPDGTRARYWRETGRRVGCQGERLREAEPIVTPTADAPTIDAPTADSLDVWEGYFFGLTSHARMP